ncbi:MAG: RdgB/HAM1 family non-canonical purine NTP pyrophosphatase [Bacteroidia bacterium]|nr:RdgB/HAM1 family non-canonical purine NTP pyrophosphatase [Bacteroidia bacterium]
MKIIFASHNKHKTKEISALLDGLIQIHSLEEIGIFEELIESGSTLHENAQMKAQAVYEATDLNCFADDSGLLVEALNGEPGVYSARYAGEQKDSEANMHKLLANLKGIENRNARFSTVICLLLNGKEHYFEGHLDGKINLEKRGNEGFGYDPVFIPEGSEKTLAEMTLPEKNKISHRAKAFISMRNFFVENVSF